MSETHPVVAVVNRVLADVSRSVHAPGVAAKCQCCGTPWIGGGLCGFCEKHVSPVARDVPYGPTDGC